MLSVLAHYPPDCAPRAWTKAASGFSGAEVYRLETARGTLALRRWPAEHPSPKRLSWIHSVLTQAVANGFDRLPLPIRTLNPATIERAAWPASSCDTFVSQGGHLWELAPWLPGEADFRQNPSPVRLTAAMQALAQLHLSMAGDRPNPPSQGPLKSGPSPGLRARLEQLRRLRFGAAVAIRAAISSTPLTSGLSPQACSPGATGSASALAPQASGLTPPALASTLLTSAHEILDHFERLAPDLERQLAASVAHPVSLQPALRDIHDEHVLFVGDVVSGIIDFGAMREETVAGDIARLLGSLIGGPAKGPGSDSVLGDAANRPLTWQAGLAAYEAVRPLSDTERELVPLFDQSGLLLGAMNWLEWLFVDGRQFADLARVHERILKLLVQLRS